MLLLAVGRQLWARRAGLARGGQRDRQVCRRIPRKADHADANRSRQRLVDATHPSHGTAPHPLDEGVDRSIEGGRAIVNAIVVYEGEADSEAVDRFLSSLKSRPA